MTEKKSVKKRVTYAALAVATIASISIGALVINDDKGDSVPIADPTVTATASATPEPSETDAIELTEEEREQEMADFDANPLGFNLDKVLTEGLAPDVMSTYPDEDFGTKDGIRDAILTYRDLNSIPAFYGERPEGQDYDLIEGSLENFDSSLVIQMKEKIDERGRFAHILTVPTSGIINFNGTDYKVKKDAGTPEPKFAQPVVYIHENGTDLVIKGDGLSTADRAAGKEGKGREYTIPLEDGKFFHGSYDKWFITITPAGNGTWLIKDMTYTQSSTSVVSDSVVWERTK